MFVLPMFLADPAVIALEIILGMMLIALVALIMLYVRRKYQRDRENRRREVRNLGLFIVFVVLS